jgi:hypothetical protein
MREDVSKERIPALESSEKLLLAHMDAIDLALYLTLDASQFLLQVYDGMIANH